MLHLRICEELNCSIETRQGCIERYQRRRCRVTKWLQWLCWFWESICIVVQRQSGGEKLRCWAWWTLRRGCRIESQVLHTDFKVSFLWFNTLPHLPCELAFSALYLTYHHAFLFHSVPQRRWRCKLSWTRPRLGMSISIGYSRCTEMKQHTWEMIISQSSDWKHFVIWVRTNTRRRTDIDVMARNTAATATSCAPL